MSEHPFENLAAIGKEPMAKRNLDRITVNPNQMAGVPCIRGMRIPVATVVGLVLEGLTTTEVIRELPYLEAEDIEAALQSFRTNWDLSPNNLSKAESGSEFW